MATVVKKYFKIFKLILIGEKTMASKKIVLEGVVLYANVPPRPAQKGYETEDTGYSVLVECSKETFKQLKADGIPKLTALKTYPDDFAKKDGTPAASLDVAEGKTFIRIKATKTKGEMVFNDIPVVDEYGDALQSNIGNGSIAKVVASLEDIKGRPGKALRLKGVQVVELVEYNDSDKGVFSGLDFKKKTTTSTKTNEELNADDLFS